MWKVLLFVSFLSAGAQKLEFSKNTRVGIEVSDLSDAVGYQSDFGYRLPNNTSPESYLINLDFGDFHNDDMTFRGTVLLSIRVLETTNRITLHSSVSGVSTTLHTSGDVEIQHNVTFDLEHEFLFIQTFMPLAEGSLVHLTIHYQGMIGTSITGVYRGSYLHNGTERRC